MSIARPSIIVTPCTPFSTPKPSMSEKTHPLLPPASGRFLSPLGHSVPPLPPHRILSARLQLFAAFITLLLASAAFASILHPSIHVSFTNHADHEGFLASLRSNPGGNSLLRRDFIPMPLSQRTRETKTGLFRMKRSMVDLLPLPKHHYHATPHVEAAVVEKEMEEKEVVEVSPAQVEIAEEQMTIQQIVKVSTVKAVQAQLMREAKMRLLKRRELRLVTRMAEME